AEPRDNHAGRSGRPGGGRRSGGPSQGRGQNGAGHNGSGHRRSGAGSNGDIGSVGFLQSRGEADGRVKQEPRKGSNVSKTVSSKDLNRAKVLDKSPGASQQVPQSASTEAERSDIG